MPTAFDVRALTSTVRIELDDTVSDVDQASIRAQWAGLLASESGQQATVIRGSIAESVSSLHGADGFNIRASSTAQLADRITTEVTLTAISALSGEALMLHAAAVALDDGRVIGFVGPSGRGKTTASQALGRVYGYITDEALAVLTDGAVVPYPKPLSIGARPGDKQPAAPSAFGLRQATGDDLRLAAIVLLDRRPGIERPYVESVPLIDSLSELVPQTSYLSALDHPLRTLVQMILSTGGVRRVVYSEAESLPSLIDDIVATIDDDAPLLTDVTRTDLRDCDCFMELMPGEPLVSDPPFRDAAPGTYRRTNYTDALLVDDRLLILMPHEITVLEGVGPIVWLASNDATEDELQAAVLRQLPEPPEGVDPELVVVRAIQQMVDARLLARR